VLIIDWQVRGLCRCLWYARDLCLCPWLFMKQNAPQARFIKKCASGQNFWRSPKRSPVKHTFFRRFLPIVCDVDLCIPLCRLETSEFAKNVFSHCFSLVFDAFSFSGILCILSILTFLLCKKITYHYVIYFSQNKAQNLLLLINWLMN